MQERERATASPPPLPLLCALGKPTMAYRFLNLVSAVLVIFFAHSGMAKVEETCSMQDGSLVDKATGISFPLELAFDSAKKTKFTLLGELPRMMHYYCGVSQGHV